MVPSRYVWPKTSIPCLTILPFLEDRKVYVSAGAGFVVVLTGAVMTMPGLPKQPAAYGIDVNDDGVITGLF